MDIIARLIHEPTGRIVNLWITTERHYIEGHYENYVKGQCDSCNNIYCGYPNNVNEVIRDWMKEHAEDKCPPRNRKAKPIY